MFAKVLFGKTKNILALLVKSDILKNIYLAGGTACALQLGHRISYDLDFFTKKRFNALPLVKKLERIKAFKLERTAEGTILGNFGRIRFSLFYYPYPLLFTPKNFLRIKIADLKDIAAMKIVAISERGTKRDFVDLYVIVRKIPLKKCLSFYNKKYGRSASDYFHILKSLVYFEDAEKEPMPKMLIPVSWKKVKIFFKEEIKNIKELR